MKLLFDENLSPALAELIADLFPNLTHVHRCGLGGADDDVIWRYALEHNFAVVSKDGDFTEKAVSEMHSPKFIWLRTGNCSVSDTERLLRRNAILLQHFSENEDRFSSSWVVLNKNKLNMEKHKSPLIERASCHCAVASIPWTATS